VVLPFDHGAAGTGRWWGAVVQAGESLPPLASAVAVLLLAGPQRLAAPESKRALTNIEFCIDVSGSMGTRFGEGTRYDASMQAINAFLDYRTGDAFGLTFFGNSVLHWVPLTSDISAFRCAPPFMRPENVPPWMGGTEIGKALRACRDVLVAREEGDRMIILITDGMSADLGNGADAEVAREMREAGIVVYAVHIAEGNPPPPIGNITRSSGGEVFPVGDATALKVVFETIDHMKTTRMEVGVAQYVDDFVPYCIAGLILVGCYALFQLGLRYTPW
jgi:Ca-activated chloride channel family protein